MRQLEERLSTVQACPSDPVRATSQSRRAGGHRGPPWRGGSRFHTCQLEGRLSQASACCASRRRRGRYLGSASKPRLTGLICSSSTISYPLVLLHVVVFFCSLSSYELSGPLLVRV